jgi:hypothetical protein
MQHEPLTAELDIGDRLSAQTSFCCNVGLGYALRGPGFAKSPSDDFVDPVDFSRYRH